MTTYQRQPQADRRRPAEAPPTPAEEAKPPGLGLSGSGRLGISFLGELDQPADLPAMDEWQRYVEDRLRHYSISHR